MKTATKYIFSIISAIYFLLAGTGFNVVNYCCNSCSDAGIAALANGSCEVVHHYSTFLENINQSKDLVCSNIEHHPSGCHLLRLFIDTPSAVTRLIISDNSINNIDLFCIVGNNLILRSLLYTFSISPPPNLSFFSSGREILTLHSVLII